MLSVMRSCLLSSQVNSDNASIWGRWDSKASLSSWVWMEVVSENCCPSWVWIKSVDSARMSRGASNWFLALHPNCTLLAVFTPSSMMFNVSRSPLLSLSRARGMEFSKTRVELKLVLANNWAGEVLESM